MAGRLTAAERRSGSGRAPRPPSCTLHTAFVALLPPAQEAIDTCPVSCIHWVTAPQLTLLEETMGRMERVAAWLLVRAPAGPASSWVPCCARRARLAAWRPGCGLLLRPRGCLLLRPRGCLLSSPRAHRRLPAPAPRPPQMTGGGKGANLNVFMEAATAWEKRQAALRARASAETSWAFWQGAGPATGSTMQDAARQAADGGGASSSLGRGVNAATIAAAARKWRDYQRARRNKEQRLLTASSSSSSVDADASP